MFAPTRLGAPDRVLVNQEHLDLVGYYVLLEMDREAIASSVCQAAEKVVRMPDEDRAVLLERGRVELVVGHLPAHAPVLAVVPHPPSYFLATTMLRNAVSSAARSALQAVSRANLK